MKIDLILRHEDFLAKHGRGRTAIVIDVLRATTSIVTAIMNGVSSIVPVMTSEEAFRMREKHGYLLAGEENGLMIQGFDFGNSPLEFERNRVKGKTLVLCTSNGTKAIVKASAAEEVVLASFLNASSVAASAARLGRDVVILCAGTIGQESLEDTVCGGMIADALGGELSPNALEARRLFLKHKDDVLNCLRDSFHGQDLIKLGFAKDLEYASQVDKTDVLPVLDENGTIVGKKFERGET